MSRATGGFIASFCSSGKTPWASGGPSTSTISGCSSRRAFFRARAQPGPWCRTPKIESPNLEDLSAGMVEVIPILSLFHHGFEIFEPDDTVLNGVLDNGAGEAGGHISGMYNTV